MNAIVWNGSETPGEGKGPRDGRMSKNHLYISEKMLDGKGIQFIMCHAVEQT